MQKPTAAATPAHVATVVRRTASHRAECACGWTGPARRGDSARYVREIATADAIAHARKAR